MKYQLIAIDMDDTLLNSNHEVSPENQKAIHHLEDLGVYVVFCSGRPTPSLIKKKHYLKNPDKTYLISFNGGAVHKLKDMSLLHSKGLHLQSAHKIVQTARKYNITAQTYKGDKFYVESSTIQADTYSKITQLNYEAVGPLEDFITENPPKILLNGEPEILAKIYNELKSDTSFNMVFSKPQYLECLNPETNKGTAVAFLAKHLGIPQDAIITMGDSYNDIEMLKYAGQGLAVANAQEDVKKIAALCLDSNNDQHALVEVVRRFFY